jgi:epoxide hydrolase 4
MTPSDLKVKHGTVEANGLRIHYVEKGEGPLVLLLHGFPEFWWSWRYQLEPLAKAGYRAVAPDLRGYNDTERKGPYDLHTLAQDVAELIRAQGAERCPVISHDWGGAVGWHLAAHHPHRVERLCVLNCPHPAMMQRALFTKLSQIKRSWYIFFFQLPWIPERRVTEKDALNLRRMYRANAKDRAHLSDEEIAPFREAIQKPGAATATINWYRAAMRGGFLRALQRRRKPRIECPVTLLWAKDDQALGYDDLVPGTERYAKNLTIKTIDKCGHFLQAERPDLVNPMLLDFLR